MYAPDTIIITWLLLNRKGVKGRIDNAGMPLIQLSQETAFSRSIQQMAGGKTGQWAWSGCRGKVPMCLSHLGTSQCPE